MNKILKYGKKALYIAAWILVLCSLLSIFRNSSFKYFKLLDFPRIQLFLSTILCLLILVIPLKNFRRSDLYLFSGLILSFLINSYFLVNYTSFVEREVPLVQKSDNVKDTFSIMLSNVLQKNRTSEKLKSLIKEKNPDIFLGMETDQWWDDQLRVLSDIYPYSKRVINDKTYGMLVYSKLPLENISVEYLSNDNVPSIHGILSLESGRKVSFHFVHPVPPTDFKDLPDNQGEKETELKKLGRKIKNDTLPLLVAGDLNDVVWAKVSTMTNTKNLLYDLRVGNGFYNSFDAKKFFARWPLDHVFVSKNFRLNKFERLSDVNSDHFPIFVELSL